MKLGNYIFIEDRYDSVNQIINKSHSGTPKAAIITPSTGNPFLSKAIASVINQDFRDIIHVIIVDGIEFEKDVHDIISEFPVNDKLKTIELPYNTGKNGLNGHRIYASVPLLINADYIFFLDEDNWWDSNHVSSLIKTIEKSGLDWAHSMRKIYSSEERYIAEDNCESIGMYPPFSALKKNWPSYVDTNCYCFKRNTIVQTAHYWYHPLRADRYFFHQLAQIFPNYGSSKMYTSNYRLKRNGLVPPDYILTGNEYMLERYNGSYPWT